MLHGPRDVLARPALSLENTGSLPQRDSTPFGLKTFAGLFVQRDLLSNHAARRKHGYEIARDGNGRVMDEIR
jgi:hypothetical protein